LVLVVVPLLGLLVLSSSVTWSLSARSHQAAETEHLVSRLSLVVAAESAMRQESQPLGTSLLSLPSPDGSGGPGASEGLSGLPVPDPARLADLAGATDRALDAAGADVAGIDRARLRSIRAGELPRAAGIDALNGLLVQFSDAPARLLAELDEATRAVTGSAQLTDAMAAVKSARDLTKALGAEFSAVAALFFVPGDDERDTRALVAAHTRRLVAGDRLDTVEVPAIAEAWKAIANSDRARSVDGAYELAMGYATGGPAAMGDASGVAEGGQNATDYQTEVFGLLSTTTVSVRDIARSLREEADAQLARWIAFAATVAGVSVLLSLWCARSILRPLRRLAGHAGAVSRGELDVDPGGRRVPGDIAVAFGAMGELVATLRLLEAKTQALAACDLSSPALVEPLPGAIGRSLERSAHVLSVSLGEQDRLREHLMHQASHDILTGLYNRTAAGETLRTMLVRAGRTGRGVAVTVVDLDEFKRTNDTFGHDRGDQVLRAMAGRVTGVAGDATFVARLGNDEFVVLHTDVGDPLAVTDVARRLLAALAEPLPVGGVTLNMSASVGIAFAWDGTAGADQVLAWADLALGRAKRRPGGAVEIYDEELQDQLRHHVDVEQALTATLGRGGGGLFLVYQPVVDLATMRTTGVEALVRWDRPGLGIQAPDSFIPVAETSDLIIDLDRWVAGQALGQLGAWNGAGPLGGLDMAVNVSGRHLLSRRLHGHVADLLTRTGIDPRRLIVEITETVLLGDLDGAAAELADLRSLGVRVAIDDFGTGYTSITHLQQLPVDIIKIDRSFIERLDHDRDRNVSALITDVAHQLGAVIVAEGVETEGQLGVVRELGCDQAQGFLLARPLSPHDLSAWMPGTPAATAR
jgi:diguanylate cyclase (GGDEF)-like protein